MAGLMILNPKPRRRRSTRSPSRRKRKMTAKQLKFFGPRKRKAKKSASKKPKVVIVETNPRRAHVAKRKRRHGGKRRRGLRMFNRNPRRVRRYRRNPVEGVTNFASDSLGPAAIGALGAVGTDILLGYLPMPAGWGRGMGQPIMRILASLGVGWVVAAASKNDRYGAEAAAGGMVVALYSLFRPWVAQSMPFRMARYVPMGKMGRRGRMGMRRYVPMRGLASVPRGNHRPPNAGNRLALKGVGARRVRRMGAFVNPARTATGITPAMMRYIATR